MAEKIEAPWQLPWNVEKFELPEADSPALREESLQAMQNLPAVPPETINPSSEVVVRAPNLAPQAPPVVPTIPWELDWSEPETPTREIHQETEQIASDEGAVDDGEGNIISYKDSRGHLTGGIGHLMSKEEASLYPEGTPIPQEVVDQWFIDDMEQAQEDAQSIVENQIGKPVPPEVENILVNMAFNLGATRLRKFKKMLAAIEAGDYNTAADEMIDSKWYNQVGRRSRRLVARMRKVGQT
jgi:lysozyme